MKVGAPAVPLPNVGERVSLVLATYYPHCNVLATRPICVSRATRSLPKGQNTGARQLPLCRNAPMPSRDETGSPIIVLGFTKGRLGLGVGPGWAAVGPASRVRLRLMALELSHVPNPTIGVIVIGLVISAG